MSDRVIDVDRSLKGYQSVRFCYDNGQVISTSQLTINGAERLVRKRVPSGGKARPEREKPFLNTRYSVNLVSGSFRNLVNGGVYHDRVGCVDGQYTLRGGGPNLRTVMSFPHGSTQSNAQAYPGAVPPLNPDLLSQAEVKAYNQLKGKGSAASPDFGVWFGERRETAQLLQQGVFGVLNLARSIAQKDYRASAQVLRDAFGVSATPRGERARQRKVERWLRKELKKAPSTARRTLASAENAVLSYNLGLSPMLSDLQQAHIRLQTGDLLAKTTVKAVARHSRLINGEENLSWPQAGTSLKTTCSSLHGYTVTFKATPAKTDIAMLQRLNLTNPASVAFNLTRLSFILDYFAAMGDYLDSLDVPLGFVWEQGSWTQVVRTTVKYELKSPGSNVARGQWVLNHTQRKLYGSFPVPIPPLSLKGKDLTFKQSVNTSLIGLKSLRSLFGG